jgi:hypothetical protein
LKGVRKVDVVAEFVLDGYQFQKVANGSWSLPLYGCRKRKLDKLGNAVSEWESIPHNDYFINKRKYVENRMK